MHAITWNENHNKSVETNPAIFFLKEGFKHTFMLLMNWSYKLLIIKG